MKWRIPVALALMAGVSALGQGQFVFNNRVPPDINAKFVISDFGLSSVVPGSTPDVYTLQILGGPSGSTFASWTELGTTTFRTGAAAGYVNPLTVTVPGATVSADFTLNIFGTTSGKKFPVMNGSFTTPVAVAPNPPPNAPLGTAQIGFGFLPEPSSLSLGTLAGAVWLLLWRKQVRL